MAAKRISSSAVNWAAFADLVLEGERHYFQAMKGRNESYIRRVAANPESLPKIDWNYYKSKITIPGLVDTFQKSYEGLSIPYPSDQGLIGKINEEEKEMEGEGAKFVKTIDEEIVKSKELLKKLEAELPYSEMMIEEYYIANPDLALYPYNDLPTAFPHGPEEVAFSKELRAQGKI